MPPYGFAIEYFQTPLFPVAQVRPQLVAMFYPGQQRLHLLRIVEAGPSGEDFVHGSSITVPDQFAFDLNQAGGN